ncbi:CDP-alcohol phosphatidyltransferase family protein [Clostridium sp. Marseille-P299]|uniref:CDP-alcohol phosphatidyltransferase family protein n=1 Tax=Clostridium sp. Marseille-P299 TaxID=1805477 RepID=UPI0008363098|nr:CDP-alcohol phosphatidyltransferase family protein [Clostridium sp. Marseille-P299]
MIGFYNYSVILTYIGLGASIFGMTQVFAGNFTWAFFCLMISGTCDMFDGKIARAMKNRTDQEKVFGIQIDSLCDLICFGMLPAMIGYAMSENKKLGGVASVLFVLGAVIRLGYFNVMEQERQQITTEHREYYQGLPVTTVAIILPAVYIVGSLLNRPNFPTAFSIIMIIVSFLFVLDFKVKKPGNLGVCLMTAFGILVVVALLSVTM